MQDVHYYFSPLKFKRTEMFDTYTAYTCKVRTNQQVSRDQYVQVLVMNDDAWRDEAHLHQLRWFHINVSDELAVPVRVAMYPLSRSQKDPDMSDERVLRVAERDYHKTTYTHAHDPRLMIILLHNDKLKSRLQWPDALTLHQAIDTFKCIIRRTDF